MKKKKQKKNLSYFLIFQIKNVKFSKRMRISHIRWMKEEDNNNNNDDDKCKCRIGLKPIESA